MDTVDENCSGLCVYSWPRQLKVNQHLNQSGPFEWVDAGCEEHVGFEGMVLPHRKVRTVYRSTSSHSGVA